MESDKVGCKRCIGRQCGSDLATLERKWKSDLFENTQRMSRYTIRFTDTNKFNLSKIVFKLFKYGQIFLSTSSIGIVSIGILRLS